MISQDDDNINDKNKSDPVPKNTTVAVDPWAKYNKIRRVGRVEREPGNFVSHSNQILKVTQRNDQILPSTHSSERPLREIQGNDVSPLARVTSTNEIRLFDHPSTIDCVAINNSAISNKDDASHNCDSFVASDATVVSNYCNNSFIVSNENINNFNDISTREKKNSITISIHEEIRKSFSRTRSMSITMIKNIFKKSKAFHNSSDTLIKSRSTSAADAIIPNFIFKYHTEDVEDPLPQSDQTGWVRQCWSAFASKFSIFFLEVVIGGYHIIIVENNHFQ